MLNEEIETINKRLIDYFGKTSENRPLWRVVWADKNLTEMRNGTFDKFDAHGNHIGSYTGVELRPKYQHIINRYVLERHLYIPDNVETDLTKKFSYEPIWTFEDAFKNPLPPKWEAIQFIIMTVNEAAAKAMGTPKYKESNEQHSPEANLARIETLKKELYGNETSVGDNLAIGSGVGYTTSKEKVH